MSRIQTAAESSHAGRIWAAAQSLAELLLVVGKFLDRAPEPRRSQEFPPALCGLDAVRSAFINFVSLLGWPPPPDRFGLEEAVLETVCCQRVLPPGIAADAIMEKLAAFCDLMLDRYRLRCQHLPRLKTTQGWVEYLNALVALRFPDGHRAPCCLKGSEPNIYAALAKVLYGRPN